jgi:serine/threonine-protein phosphatase 2A regulatory subunit B''
VRSNSDDSPQLCARDAALQVFTELGQAVAVNTNDTTTDSRMARYLTVDTFPRITKDICRFPSHFNAPLFQRVLDLWNENHPEQPQAVVTFEMFEAFWQTEMDPYDMTDRFYRLVKQIHADHIVRDDFLPFIKALLQDHPGLEFLSTHAEFQEKYAVTVITRIFYTVNRCHTGRITARQIRRSDLLQAFQQVDEEEDINKVTRYFSYEHFYVLYCRFWELDHDRDYRITREDLLKYGDHSLSHMIVDRIFDAAPRPFCTDKPNREYLSYEDFIYFMLSEEDKSNEVSVRYWFQCVDVDGDGKLNNMEMRSFYAVQLHRMQCMGHEIVPFEDMLCQMMDMIKPACNEYLVTEDFLQPECSQVSGALFDALFNLNKYCMFEQRDPFVERQKREDEFSSDWDRFACIDYNRLAMEEEAREEEAMEIDWVTVDDEEEDDDDEQQPRQQQQAQDAGSSEAPF